MKNKITLILVFAILMCFTANAASTAIYEPSINSIVVNGDAFGMQNLTILKSEQKLGEISNENLPFFVIPFLADGLFEIRVPLDNNVNSGNYDVYLGGEKIEPSIYIINVLNADKYIREVLTAKATAEELRLELISDTAINELGLIRSEIEKYSEKISALMMERKPFEGYDDFYAKYEICKLYIDVNSGDVNNALEILEKNEALFTPQNAEVEILKTFNSLNDSGKQILLKELIAADYTKREMYEIFLEAYFLSAFKSAEYYVDLKKIIENNANEYNVDLSEINLCADPGEIYKKAMEEKDKITKLSEISPLISSIVQNNKPVLTPATPGQSQGRPSSGGGGGGGGSSFSGYVSMTENALPIKGETTDTKEDISFTDIGEYEWAKEAIESLKKLKIVNGVSETKYEPERAVTRAEFSKMAATLMKLDSGESDFDDVKISDWYYPYVSACYTSGLVYGVGNNFNPDSIIKREDAAVILFRITKMLNLSFDGMKNFNDNDAVSEYAKEAVGKLAENKLIMGDEADCFNPQDNLTRAEAAVLFYRIVNLIG